MANLSKLRRDKLVHYIETLKQHHNDDKNIRLLQELELALTEKKYGLVWEEHTEDVYELLEQNVPIFSEYTDNIVTTNENDGYNFVLEGDNLHSLNLLTKTHHEKIDVIYIDPPYNTGAKNWKYNNNFVDGNDTFRHSKFLSFLHKRLELAYKLLKNSGIIVVTIDDYEIENVLLLMNEIFGESSHLGTIVIKNNPQGRSNTSGFQVSHEYALFYGKRESRIGRLPRTESQLGRYNEKDSVGPFEWRNFRAQYSQESASMVYPIYIKRDGTDFRVPVMEWDPITQDYRIMEEASSDEIISWPIDNDGRMRTWKWAKESLEAKKNTETGIRKDKNGDFAVYYKGRLNEPDMLPYTFWDNPLYSASTFGANLLADILGRGKFNYPKSLFAVMDCIRVASDNNPKAIVLDFFAGSGTTGQAVMELNKLDNGKRKFILCTNNESNICQEVTYERVRRVAEGYSFQGKIEEELFKIKLTLTNLRKIDRVFGEIESIKAIRMNDYDSFSIKSEDGYLSLKGIRMNVTEIAGIPHNIKYFKTSFVPKTSDEESVLSMELMSGIKELVELENMNAIDGVKRAIILTENELTRINKIEYGGTLYLSTNVLLSHEDDVLIQNNKISVVDIPDYYYLDVLIEVGER